MAIDVTPIQSMRPAFLRLTPSILDAARPQIEPVGYNQRYGFIGPANPLQQTNETSPTYLRAFVGSPNHAELLNEPLTVGTLGRDELVSSRAALKPEGRQQLDFFGTSEAASEGIGLSAAGLARYSAIQDSDARAAPERRLSIMV